MRWGLIADDLALLNRVGCFVLCCVVLCRRASLELILPKAQLFQESTDRLQLWLISVEQDLAELRTAERGMLHLQEATEQAKVRVEEKNRIGLTVPYCI